MNFGNSYEDSRGLLKYLTDFKFNILDIEYFPYIFNFIEY